MTSWHEARKPLGGQVVRIASTATSFTAVCEICADLEALAGWQGATFGGRLDLDIRAGTFLCRRGHQIRVERNERRRDDPGQPIAAA